MEHDELGYNYSDIIAERTQAYMWLLVELAAIEKSNRPGHEKLLSEGMMMLESIRLSISVPDKTILKGIHGGRA